MDGAGRPPVVVVMGISGSGKTTLGEALAERHGFRFHDADSVHPPANVAKMRAGIPLTDADRAPWLQRLAALLGAAEGPTVLACSALKASYRAVLAAGAPQTLFVHLTAPTALIRQRMRGRAGHYMPASLLESQLATLEAPGAGDHAMTLSSDRPVEVLAQAVIDRLALDRTAPPATP